eukprot:TRINITY_DN36830_c0_g3_i1.p1 TRINITY_DN36830_c0_g3~~TRINITY_DN36830_c0_g3_i1.p1  ORF type:complete len:230 (-),score=53.17 TRINITY_DN36830_c0_g3_i1:99-788(-)
MEAVRWGIVGVGNVCEVKSGPGFQRATNSSLVAVMRRSLDMAQDFADRHGVPKAYGTVEELLADPEVNAVYIATPPSSHLELAQQVAAAGKPCYLEKPMARNLSESTAIARAFEEAGVPLFVAYYRRGQARFQQARRIVHELDLLGQITDATYRFESGQCLSVPDAPWRMQPEVSGGGVVMDVGCHALDIVDYVLGPVECIGSTAMKMGGAEIDVEDCLLYTSPSPRDS